MELHTLGVTREEAEVEVRRYRRARTYITLSREDERMLAAYRAIAAGFDVIDLHRAIELGGTVSRVATGVQRYDREQHKTVEMSIEVELPRVAAFRADKRWVWCDGVGRDGTVTLRDTGVRRPGASDAVGSRAVIGETRMQLVEVFGRDDARKSLSIWGEPTFRALLPTVPPHLRPTRMLYGERVLMDISRFVVMWEAEWQLDRTVPPGDPVLLRHIGGTLYRVYAKWDLTPVEQAVLAGRRPTRKELGS